MRSSGNGRARVYLIPRSRLRLGLAADQVTFIRVLLEQRRFKPAHYYRLFQLGGGRRFRTERGMERDAY